MNISPKLFYWVFVVWVEVSKISKLIMVQTWILLHSSQNFIMYLHFIKDASFLALIVITTS